MYSCGGGKLRCNELSFFVSFLFLVSQVLAAVRGMDYHIFGAITGPQAKKYNGGRGEIGLEMQREVAEQLKEFFIECGAGLGEDAFRRFVDFVGDAKSTRCEPYVLARYRDAAFVIVLCCYVVVLCCER